MQFVYARVRSKDQTASVRLLLGIRGKRYEPKKMASGEMGRC